MSDAPWVSLGQRRDPPAEAEVPYEGIPEHSATPLWRWVRHWERNPEEILLALRIPQEGAVYNPWNDLSDAAFGDESLFLDIIEFVLGRDRIPSTKQPSAVKRLRWLLDRGGSSWRFADDGRALERRIVPTVVEAARRATTPGTNAGEHLATAWRAAYGRQPDPGKAYAEAIKAVEAAAIPIVEPNHARATLGTMPVSLRLCWG